MVFLPQEIIRKKRDGAALDPADIAAFISGLTKGSVTDAQAAAFAMAVFFRDMTPAECVALTKAMRDSGEVLAWDLPGPALDKHSTGGVGDTVSLMLGPVVAACGGYVPMISGRGLGHTGGTLDKLEAIPGYNATPDNALFRKVVRQTGCAIIGQTANLAPADKKLYGIRDVTATVESIPLITASILSKKLAAGLDGLVMDVKSGSGAFMATLEGARALAKSIVAVANGAGLPTTALITDMDGPLADAAGNALEVSYAIDFLTGVRREARMLEVVIALAADMLVLGKLATTIPEARAKAEQALISGAATERFARMVTALGGPANIIENPRAHLAQAPITRPVHAKQSGMIARIDTRGLGLAVVALGGGRTRSEDAIDPAVGLTQLAERGDMAGAGKPLCMVHARNEAGFAAAEAMVQNAYHLGEKPMASPAIIERISA
ncbi:MAG: thymidine phosphorylase [Bosea sp. (in: a-proteobacteria)]